MQPHELFKLQRQCLRLVGHNLREQAANGGGGGDGVGEKSQLFKQWQKIKFIGSLVLVASGQWPMMSYVIDHIDNLPLATAALSIIFTNLLTVIKITTFLLYKQKFIALMNEFETLLQKMRASSARQRVEEANMGARSMVRLYFYCVASTGLYFMIGPVIKIVWAEIMLKHIERELPMPMRFNFDFQSTPGYEFCYIYTAVITLTVVMYASAVDGLFVSFTTNLRAHFQCLQHYIQANSFVKNDKELQAEISAYIHYHLLLLKISNRVREVYEPIVFGQFLMTSLQVCVIIYQLVTHVGAIMIWLAYCTFLSSILIQLLIYCYGGEMLRIESFAVSTAIQLSNWYNLPPKHRRVLSFVLMRSQRAVVIKAGFYEASLENYMTIIKAALSYITIIQSIE